MDLSGAFRLRTPAAYSAWYNSPHTQPELLAEAAYGLPEFCRERIPAARLVANPGLSLIHIYLPRPAIPPASTDPPQAPLPSPESP